ncbi:MAG TPA: Lpg1974 family pore-forming outer membrane protein, partial [Caulobacteraceae bacterium]
DWGDGREVRLTYQPGASSWKVSAAYRYGRTNTDTARLHLEEDAGPKRCGVPIGSFVGQLLCNPDFSLGGGPPGAYYLPQLVIAGVNFSDSSVKTREEHRVADFAVGRDVGIGLMTGGENSLAVVLRYAELQSSTAFWLRAVERQVPDAWFSNNAVQDSFDTALTSEREFKGVGPILKWDASVPLWGDATNGHLDVDWSVAGGVLFGRTDTHTAGDEEMRHYSGRYIYFPMPQVGDTVVSDPPAERKQDATVPVIDLSLGLSYDVGRIKVGAGYRWERYFDVLDVGYDEHQDGDRTIDGPYFKLAIGFGG